MVSGSGLVFWPAPDGVEASPDYRLRVNGEPVFVWPARVREELYTPPGAKIASHRMGGVTEAAAFAIFDFHGAVEVEIRPSRDFSTASVHPISAGIVPEVADGFVRFKMAEPRPLTVLLDGSDSVPIHLFADYPESDVPDPADPNVIYFGPGVHLTDGIYLKSGQTLYIAGGALVRGKVPDDATWVLSELTGLKHCDSGPVISINNAENVRICGRGVMDFALIPHPARNSVALSQARNVTIEGITLRDSAGWNVTISDSDHVRVEGLKLISGRLNSDGVNSVNSRDVTIRRCFVRNHDDSFAVKAILPDREVARIVVEGCTVWNDWGYGLGVTYETRAPIHDLVFRDCDVISARHWALGVHVVDSGTISNVVFEDVRVEDFARPVGRFGDWPNFLRIGVTYDMWGTDSERGHIRGVTLKNVSLTGSIAAHSEILGCDEEHGVTGVTLENVTYLGKKVRSAEDMNLTLNEFVSDIEFK